MGIQRIGEVRKRNPGIVPDAMRKRRKKGTGSLWFRASDQRWIGEITTKGERHLVSSTDYEDAERQLNELSAVGRIERGEPLMVGTRRWALRPLAYYADWWLDIVGGTVRPVTLRGYQRIVRMHIVPSIGHLLVGELDTRFAYEPIRRAEEKGLRPNSVRNIRNTLHAMLRQAVIDEALPYNPLAEIKVEAGELRGAHVRADEEAVDAIETAVGEGDTVADMVRLALLTGARLGELVSLRWTDLSWRSAQLRIERTNTMDADGHRMVGPTKTKRSRRTIGMSAPVLFMLRRRWVEAGEPKDGWIFPALRGGDKSVQPTWVTATLKKRMIAAGFEPVRFHDLRHIAILRMLNGVDSGGSSMDAVTVAEIVGHRTPNVTLSIYGAGVITGRQREALDILARRGYSAGTPQPDTPQG